MNDSDQAVRHHETPAQVAELSDAMLKCASGSTVFQRGRAYASSSSGAVQLGSEEPGKTPVIHATVQGTEPYATEVWIDEGEVTGSCDCGHAPAAVCSYPDAHACHRKCSAARAKASVERSERPIEARRGETEQAVRCPAR